MKDHDDFYDDWNIDDIQSIEDFKNKILNSENNYWCDHLIYELSSELLNINILIFNSDINNKNYSIYNTLCEYDKNKYTIFLLYENECHFKLIGYFNNYNMISNFLYKEIPNELIMLYNLK